MKKWVKKIMGCMAVTLLLTACGANNIKAGNTETGILNLLSTSPSNTLHSIENPEAVNGEIIENFTEGLIVRDLSHAYVPGMAESWEVSADQMTYTFKVRDTQWSNGDPVTASDFVFAFQLMGTLPGAAYGEYLESFVNGKEILAGTKDVSELGAKAIDEKTLEIKLITPVSYFLDVLVTPTMTPINKAFYEAVGADNYGSSKETVLANGPFILTDYSAEEGYTLTKNEDYWDKENVQLSAVNVRVVPQAETQALLFDNGEADKLYPTGSLSEKYEAEGVAMEVQKENRTQWMYLSGTTKVENKLLGNKNFRAAVAHAFDKEAITNQVLKNGSFPTDALVPKDFVFIEGKDYRETSGKYNDFIYSPDAAEKYFAAAKKELGDIEYAFSINIIDEDSDKMIFEYIQAEVEKNLPGVKMHLNVTPRQSYYATLFEHATPAGTAGWSADLKDPITYFNLFTSKHSINFAQYKNPKYDALIEKTATPEMMTNPEARWEVMFEAEEILLDDYILIPIYQKAQKMMVTEGVTGLLTDAGNQNRNYKFVEKN